MLKKHTFKTISILLITTFILSFIQPKNITKVSACDPGESEYVGDWIIEKYEYDEDEDPREINITAFRGSLKTRKVVIPSTLKNIPVEEISLSVFDNTNITDIEIPGSITGIQANTFLPKLRNINVDSKNKYYSSENGVLFNKNKTALVKYPSGKTEKTYKIPESVKTINTYAFYGAANLETIIIPKSVKNIEAVEFEYDHEPSAYSFYGCSKLKNINVDSKNTAFSSKNGVLYDKKKATLIKYPEGKTQKSFKIPDSVKNVRLYALDGCKKLRNLTVPKNVVKIQTEKYWDAPFTDDYFEKITVDRNNKNYSSINGILYDKAKTKLLCYPSKNKQKSYKMPNSVKKIGYGSSMNNSKFQTITLSNNLERFYIHWSSNLPALKNIYVNRANKSLTSINGILYNKKVTELLHYPARHPQKTYTIPNNVGGISGFDFSNVKKLENFNVSKNNKLYSTINGVLLNKAKTTIIKYPAANKRKTYTTPSSVKSIKYNAFINANNLVKINLTKNVIDLTGGNEDCLAYIDLFTECKKLKNIKVNKNNKWYSDINGVLFDKKKTALYIYPRGKTQKSYTIPQSTKYIGDTLNNHKHLKSLISTTKNKVFEPYSHEYSNKKVKKYEVKYNDGNKTIKKVTVNQGEKVKSYTPKKAGHRFIGWYADTKLKKKFDFDVNTYEIKTVYAKFEKN